MLSVVPSALSLPLAQSTKYVVPALVWTVVPDGAAAAGTGAGPRASAPASAVPTGPMANHLRTSPPFPPRTAVVGMGVRRIVVGSA